MVQGQGGTYLQGNLILLDKGMRLRNWSRCSYSARPGSPQQGSLSGTKEEHKPKLLSPDIFRWGGVLPREGVGAKKLGMSLDTRQIKLFGRGIRDFAGISRRCPQSLRKKQVLFLAPTLLEIWVEMEILAAKGESASLTLGVNCHALLARIARCNRDVRCDSNRTPPNR